MSVTFNRAYGTFAAGATATLDAVTEAALVAQGLAAYTAASAVNPSTAPPPVGGPITAGLYGPAVVTNIPIGNVALTGLETNGVAQTAFAINLTEIFVPHWNTWTGASVLAGTTVGVGTTDTRVLWLFGSNGNLIAYTAIAGTDPGSASVFNKVPFNVPVTLAPGRYFLGNQEKTATPTPRHVVTAMGAEPRSGIVTATASFAASLAALSAAPITVPTTYTTGQAPIMQLYS